MSTHTPGPWTDEDMRQEIEHLRDINAELLEALEAAETRLYNMTPEDISPSDADRREGALFLIRAAIRKARGESPAKEGAT